MTMPATSVDSTPGGSPTRRRRSTMASEHVADNNTEARETRTPEEIKIMEEERDQEEDRDDKSWRTRGESSPTASSAAFGSPRSLLMEAPRSWSSMACSDRSPQCPERLKRQLFWRNVVRQYNFVDQQDERELLLSLTQGIDWMNMTLLPRKFMARHKEIYHLICRADYERSSTIQRDVTRTFSIFERSQLPSRERDLNAQQRALFRVLNAVAEAEDGYCQGMNFIAALFLVEGLDEADAYALFLYLLKKRHLARIYLHSSTFLDDYLAHFEQMLKSELPDLYQHLHTQGFAIPMYGIEWFTTLFSLSTKPDLACAIFDLFFVGVQDIFLRMGLAILKLLEASLMCMTFEDFLRDFKPLVRHIDPYQAVLQALSFTPNPVVPKGEDTTTHIARVHYQRIASRAGKLTSSGQLATPPRAFHLHRTLPPELAAVIRHGDVAQVITEWLSLTALRPTPLHCLVLGNEILHFAIWHGQVPVAVAAIHQLGADVDNTDETGLTPLHFAVIRNQPDMVRLLLCFGANPTLCGGRWSGSADGLTPLESAKHWKFCDTTAARLVLEHEVCLCCNTKFDAFAFHRMTCKKCKFQYCGRGDDPCIDRHECPAKHRRRMQLDALLASTDPNDAVSSSEDSPPSPSSSTEHRISRHNSDTSSSFVYISSPVGDLPTDHAPEAALPTSTDSGLQSSGLLASLTDWFGLSSAPAHNDDVDRDDGIHGVDLSRGLEFPTRPEWYCNAADCHAVFAFFSRGDDCVECRGLFCSRDFDSPSSRCRRCAAEAKERSRVDGSLERFNQ